MVAHRWSGTVNLTASIAVSVAFTALSTAFNLFAMRHGVFIVGDGGRSLCRTCQPRLLLLFTAPAVRVCLRTLR